MGTRSRSASARRWSHPPQATRWTMGDDTERRAIDCSRCCICARRPWREVAHEGHRRLCRLRCDLLPDRRNPVEPKAVTGRGGTSHRLSSRKSRETPLTIANHGVKRCIAWLLFIIVEVIIALSRYSGVTAQPEQLIEISSDTNPQATAPVRIE